MTVRNWVFVSRANIARVDVGVVHGADAECRTRVCCAGVTTVRGEENGAAVYVPQMVCTDGYTRDGWGGGLTLVAEGGVSGEAVNISSERADVSIFFVPDAGGAGGMVLSALVERSVRGICSWWKGAGEGSASVAKLVGGEPGCSVRRSGNRLCSTRNMCLARERKRKCG